MWNVFAFLSENHRPLIYDEIKQLFLQLSEPFILVVGLLQYSEVVNLMLAE